MEIKAKGIDVSFHQGEIDWNKVKSQTNCAILRCGYGSDLKSQDDTKFVRNAEECERLGIPYGVYLFSYANSLEKAQSEANHTIRLLKGRKLSLPIFYDLEDTRTTGNCNNALILEIAKTYVSALENAGYTCGIYANKYWFTTKLTDAWYDTKPKWVAQYNSVCTYAKNYDVWQYSSSGKVDGIVGNVDMNYFYTDMIKKEAPESKSLKDLETISQEVISGKWGNGAERVQRLSAEGYDVGAIQKRVNELVAKPKAYTPVSKPVAALKIGDTVKVKQNAKFYDGKKVANFVYGRKHKVKSISNDRVVITYLGVVVGAFNKKDLQKV